MSAVDLSPFSLSGRVALVTGGGRGIGYGIAMGLARAGADVCIASRDVDCCEGAADEIASLGRRSLALRVDVGDVEQVEDVVAATLQALGRIDILVNNAGIIEPVPLTEMTDAQWDRTIDIDLSGVFYCSRAVVRHMRERGGGGKIINIGSMASFRGMGRNASYCAAKGGVDLFTKALAVELAPDGIRVNAIAPGLTDTDIQGDSLKDPERRRVAASRIPMNRIMGPENFAGVAVFLASDASDMITGHTIPVDGGWLARLP
jgi:2-deoxy-D-gluconate 3-dehydrogenase